MYLYFWAVLGLKLARLANVFSNDVSISKVNIL